MKVNTEHQKKRLSCALTVTCSVWHHTLDACDQQIPNMKDPNLNPTHPASPYSCPAYARRRLTKENLPHRMNAMYTRRRVVTGPTAETCKTLRQLETPPGAHSRVTPTWGPLTCSSPQRSTLQSACDNNPINGAAPGDRSLRPPANPPLRASSAGSRDPTKMRRALAATYSALLASVTGP